MTRRGRRVAICALLIGIVIGCDQCAKLVARRVLPPGEPIAVLPGVVLCLTENAGAFLSFGSTLPAGVRFWVLTVGVSVGLLAILAWLLASRGFSAALFTGLSVIVGGGISNLLDRLAHGGRVTDFLVLGVGPLRTGVFNVADAVISAGTLLLLGGLLSSSPPARRTPDGADRTA